MKALYIDESIHDTPGFIIASCVYSEEDLNHKIEDLYRLHGFENDQELKSSNLFSTSDKKVKLREDLRNILESDCRIGIVVLPRDKRQELGSECIKALKVFISNNSINGQLNVFFDQGIFESVAKAEEAVIKNELSHHIFQLEQDSKIVKGIQLADLASHMTAILLKDKFGIGKKIVKLKFGNDGEHEMELAFEMFARLRYSFFRGESVKEHDDPEFNSEVKIENYGLYISEYCSAELAKHARDRFGTMYMGCIN